MPQNGLAGMMEGFNGGLGVRMGSSLRLDYAVNPGAAELGPNQKVSLTMEWGGQDNSEPKQTHSKTKMTQQPVPWQQSNTVTLTASASINLGIASVQFLLDGNNLGAAIAVPPYTLSWNTVQAAPGTHSLTAVATDSAGNKATSAPIAVTVVRGADATPGLRSAIVYPNPAVKTDPTIRAFLGVVNSVEVTIFDVAGHVVNSGSVSGAPTGILNGQYYYDYKWIGSKASGTYFAVIHGKAADGTIVRARVRFIVVK